MSINFPELARQAAADGMITADEVLALRRAAWPDGVIGTEEADGDPRDRTSAGIG